MVYMKKKMVKKISTKSVNRPYSFSHFILFVSLSSCTYLALQSPLYVTTLFGLLVVNLLLLSLSMLSITWFKRQRQKQYTKTLAQQKKQPISTIDPYIKNSFQSLEKSLSKLTQKVNQTETILKNNVQRADTANDIINLDISIISSFSQDLAYVFGEDLAMASSNSPKSNLVNHVLTHIKKQNNELKVLKRQHKFPVHIPSKHTVKGNVFDFPPNLINFN